MKCKNCGGPCREVGKGFECTYCGATFTKEELTPTPKVAVKQTASGTDVFDKTINGILEISCRGKSASWSGSGYLISRLGYAVTNAHVAADEDGQPCGNITVRLCGCSIPATVIALADNLAGRGSGNDLAVIKLSSLPQNATHLAFSADGAKNGETVFAVGNSLGEGTCITRGIVSDKARMVNGKRFVMTDCAVNGGNSGGPLFNAQGAVIGTITLQGRTHNGSDAEGMNYAIPADIVCDFVSGVSRKLGIRII